MCRCVRVMLENDKPRLSSHCDTQPWTYEDIALYPRVHCVPSQEHFVSKLRTSCAGSWVFFSWNTSLKPTKMGNCVFCEAYARKSPRYADGWLGCVIWVSGGKTGVRWVKFCISCCNPRRAGWGVLHLHGAPLPSRWEQENVPPCWKWRSFAVCVSQVSKQRLLWALLGFVT